MNVEITNGQNVIQLLFDEFASCLVIDTALTVNWPDCAGSVGEYYALSSYSSEKRKTLTDKLNQVLINGDEKEVFSSIKEFLTLFSNGHYSVSINKLKLDKSNFFYEEQVKYSESVPMNRRFSGAFYPYPFDKSNIFFTVPNSTLDLERVKFYHELIKKGSRPKVITVELYSPVNDDFTACYLLDGHHKAKAYIELGMDIPAVQIVKTERVEGHTQAILNASAPILKEFEFEHLLLENDENLEKVNFFEDEFLTSKLDDVLAKRNDLGIGVMKLFVNLDKSKNSKSVLWLVERLKTLSQNITMGNGLRLGYFGFNESLNCNCWMFNEINNLEDFNNWVIKTLPNNGYRA